MRDLFDALGGFLRTFGALQLFFMRLLAESPRVLMRPGLVSRQVFNTGALSLVLIMVCGFFVGAVIGLQAYSNLARFGAEDQVGPFSALSLMKELGPVITALLFAGRAGTALASEIGLMRATDQLSAMEMMAVDPVIRVAVPRFLGGVISMPLLTAIFTCIGMLGAYVVGVPLMGLDGGAFWSELQQGVGKVDVYEGIIKGVVFGIAASLIAVWEGYNAVPTAEGVGRATTRTVVITAVVILIFDFMITAIAISQG
ncbi:MAG: lipid asymmetry maintenance ABC transporter permease subunit MlaE [Pseudomonadota bacterium]